MATKKKILFVADTLSCAKKYAELLKNFDCEIETSRYDNSFANASKYNGIDLAIVELPEQGISEEIKARADIRGAGIDKLLIVCPVCQMDSLRLPIHVTSDFVAEEASNAEIITRIKNLLYPGTEAKHEDIVTIDNMTINLGTYQVKINDTPLDLTYLEYALLSFLATHPKHSYSRDELLKRVWGFDYLGGSRTVDVHIRRIRAKIGPENASKLETVRGVGYLWNA